VITSSDNQKLKELRKLAKKRDGRFMAEGEDLLDAARDAGWDASEVFVTPDADRPGTVVDPALLAKASTLGSGARAIGVYEQRWADAPTGPLTVALWGVGDPGNVGTILRGALAFGASSVALGPDCADPYGPKAVRASMGAIFHVPVTKVTTIDALPAPRIALVARAGDPLQGPLEHATLVVGAERTGLPDEVVAGCERVAHLPIAAASESLNAAMAASIALYEASRKTTNG
jgi:TrmH family RNA methyltransferase